MLFDLWLSWVKRLCIFGVCVPMQWKRNQTSAQERNISLLSFNIQEVLSRHRRISLVSALLGTLSNSHWWNDNSVLTAYCFLPHFNSYFGVLLEPSATGESLVCRSCYNVTDKASKCYILWYKTLQLHQYMTLPLVFYLICADRFWTN